jgi:hypothetical protein
VAIRPDSTAKQRTESEERPGPAARPEPIRVVVRELTRPDGKKMKVEVPVYPPFQLEEARAREAAASRGAGEAPPPQRARESQKPRRR